MHQFTDQLIRKLAAPKAGNKVHYDPSTPGFGCRVTASGARSFILNYVTRAGRERRITIGSTTNWRAADARAEARRLKQLVDQGGDPLADVAAERGAPIVNDLIERFEQEHLSRKRPGTARDYRLLLTNHVRPHLGRTKVADVTFSDIDALHRKITKTGATYQANRCIAVVGKMFALAIRWKMRPDNPAKGIERNPEQKRKRYPTPQENERLTKALDEHPDQQAADIIRLARLSGARIGEAMAARWDGIDLARGVWTKLGSTTKQKTDHVVPLSAPSRDLLKKIRQQSNSPVWVFPANSAPGHRVAVNKNWAALCKAAKISGLRIHDLRHGFASELASNGASLPLIGSLLGHSNPVTTSRYSHLYTDPQREAVERVGAILTTGKPPAEVVPLNRRGRR
jgi:integrase